MSSTSFNGERVVISILLFQLIKIPAMPIHNGFSVKFNNGLTKGEIKPKTFASLFEKIPPQLTTESQQVFPQTTSQQTAEVLRCTHEISKLLFPTSFNIFNKTDKIREKKEILYLPILKEVNETYKVIVAKAPSNLRIGGRHDSNQVIVYIVFSDEEGDTSETINMPQIYFVNKNDGFKTLDKKENIDPIIIVNNNRTVTGLSSKEVSKYVKFKSKIANRMENCKK